MSPLIVGCGRCGAKNRIPEKKQHLTARCGSCGQPLVITEAVPVRLGDDDFQSFINSAPLPVLVDFFSPNCGPCRALAPLIRQCAGRYRGKVIIAGLDTGEHPGTAAHYQIRGVPTLVVFKGGREIDRLVGAPPEAELYRWLDAVARDGRSL